MNFEHVEIHDVVQAYERKAIERHLVTSNRDPMSQQLLASRALTPVYLLKSRALEYREATARACMARACEGGDPIAYLRRAAELCGDAPFLPQGLTRSVVDYLATHTSNAYDRIALDMFARSLYDNGYRDKASAIYFYLLTSENDPCKQSSLLRRCIACWKELGDASLSITRDSGVVLSTTRFADEEDAQTDGHEDDDVHVYDKLTQIVRHQASFSWVIEIATDAGLGEDFIIGLCRHILFPPRSMRSYSLNSLADNDMASNELALPWQVEKEVLLRYVQVLTSNLNEKQVTLANQLEMIQSHVGNSSLSNISTRNLNRGTPSVPTRLPFNVPNVLVRLRHPTVIIPCALWGAFGGAGHPVTKIFNFILYIALADSTVVRSRQECI
jgi:hypothetical protein